MTSLKELKSYKISGVGGRMDNEKYAKDNTSKISKTSLSKVVRAHCPVMLTMIVAYIGGVQHLYDINLSKHSLDFYFPLWKLMLPSKIYFPQWKMMPPSPNPNDQVRQIRIADFIKKIVAKRRFELKMVQKYKMTTTGLDLLFSINIFLRIYFDS